MPASDNGDILTLTEELIPGTHLQRRVDRESGREIAPEYLGAGQGVQAAIAEAAEHGYKTLRYGGWPYVRVGSTWYRINQPGMVGVFRDDG
jgi:hypothetical protein